MDKRLTHLHVKLTENEKALVEAEAKRCGMNISTLMRCIIRRTFGGHGRLGDLLP